MPQNQKASSIAELLIQRHKKNKPILPLVPIAAVQPEPVVENEMDADLAASKKQTDMIWEEAKQNQEFYLARAKETGQPWFRHVKKQSQYSEFVLLTTEMAQSLLDHIWDTEEGNRRLRSHLKESYKRDIMAGRWVPSDESIGIDFKGVVYNGRHRLTALVESEREYPFYITFNALEEAKFTVDSGGKRTSSEKLKLLVKTPLGNKTTAFCRACMKGLNPRIKYTESEVAEFACKWENLIEWISIQLPTARSEVQAVVAKAYLWYGPNKIEPFCKRLRDISFEEGDPARALYVALHTKRTTRGSVVLSAYRRTLSAIHSLINDRPASKLYERDEDIFEWAPGWELPER
jgi:hypothetical protein